MATTSEKMDKLFGEPTESHYIECPCCKGFGGDLLRIESSSARMSEGNNREVDIYFRVFCTECQKHFEVDATGSIHTYRATGVFNIPSHDEDGEDTIIERSISTHIRFI